MSEIPLLIRTSEGLQHIPYPSDIGLDTLVDTIFSGIFSRDRYKPDDFVPQDRVKRYATNVIENLETDRESILSRQNVLKYFTDHFRDFVIPYILDASIPVTRHREDKNWEHTFEENVERVEGYRDFVRAIEKMPNSDNPELDSFKTYFSGLIKEKRFTELENMLDDIQLPSKMNLTGKFFAGGDKDPDMEGRQITVTVGKSGKEIPLEDLSIYGFRLPREESQVGIPYGQIMKKVVDEVKAKTGKKFGFLKTPINLQFEIDEDSEKVTCKAAYHKYWLKATEVDVEFNYDDFNNWRNKETHYFSTAIKRAKYNAFNEQLERYDEDIGTFANPVTELRYLATLAYYFNGKQGAYTTPEIPEIEDNITKIEGMIDPNMISKKHWSAIVGNDIEAGPERNLYVITGPNKDGKTEFLNALAINQAAAQAGWYVWNVSAEKAVFSPKDNIYTHYIQPGDIGVGSRYHHELSRTKRIFQDATPHSLILMDEPFTGTVPEAGEKQADIVMRMLGKLGATTFIAPHYSLLAETAEKLPYAGNLHTVEIKDKDGNLVYTYKIEKDSSNMTYGDILPKEMGVDEEGLTKILTERAGRGEIELR